MEKWGGGLGRAGWGWVAGRVAGRVGWGRVAGRVDGAGWRAGWGLCGGPSEGPGGMGPGGGPGGAGWGGVAGRVGRRVAGMGRLLGMFLQPERVYVSAE